MKNMFKSLFVTTVLLSLTSVVSATPPPPAVPDAGSSVALIGVALASLAAYKKMRK